MFLIECIFLTATFTVFVCELPILYIYICIYKIHVGAVGTNTNTTECDWFELDLFNSDQNQSMTS